MRMPRMSQTERAVFAACYAQALERRKPAPDNSNAEYALEDALWSVALARVVAASRDFADAQRELAAGVAGDTSTRSSAS